MDEIIDDHCDIDGYDPDGASACAHDLGALLLETFDGLVGELEGTHAVREATPLDIYIKAVAEFEHLDAARDRSTFLELMLNLVRQAPTAEIATVIFEQFRDIGVTLPLPTATTRGEGLPSTGDSLPGVPVRPAPWWFDNPDLFQCSVSYGLEYKVTCVRRTNDLPRDGPRH